MPLYSYACAECGPFRSWQSMSNAGQPIDCPLCGITAQPQVAAPFVATLPGNKRTAHQRNERSADQPRVVRRDDPGPRHDHCGHGHHHVHRSGRPWMVGH